MPLASEVDQMLIYVEDDIFKTPAKVLVNAVNTVGVMGKGIAKDFKRLYPDMFKKYQRYCEDGLLDVGKLWLYQNCNKGVLNFPTKKSWRQPSKVEYIESGLKKFVDTYTSHGITSIAFPKIGCGNGELDWDRTVHPLILKYLKALPIDIFIYSYPQSAPKPEHRDIDTIKAWLRSDPLSLGFAEAWSDICDIVKREGAQFDDCANLIVMDNPFEGIIIKELPKGIFDSIRLKLRLFAYGPNSLGPQDIFLPKDLFLSLWQSIREKGYCIADQMPPGFDEIPELIMSLLSKLSFMERVTFQKNNSDIINGLQFFRPVHEDTGDLFDGIYLAQAV